MSLPALLTPKEVAELLRKSEASVRSDVHRAPHRLPPRVLMPGSNRLRWNAKTVAAWLAQHEQQVPPAVV